jgi:hypothetical protein
MVHQVKVVAILMIVWGGLMALVGLGAASLGALIAITETSRPGRRPPSDVYIPLLVFLIIGLVILVVAVLHIIAGIRCLKFRGRVLALVALFSNIPLVFTMYCSALAIGMAVYGLIVMFQGDVAEAFRMGESGVAPEDILEDFAARDPYRRRRRRRPADFWDGPDDYSIRR